MMPRSKMPEEPADLARIDVPVPSLAENTAESCPVGVDEILDYLAVEVHDGDVLESNDLRFLRTARVAGRSYWIWGFSEPHGSAAYAIVSRERSGCLRIKYDVNCYGLTAEQFVLGDYHGIL